jgi:thioredoxin reductase/Pyruvate/2-oxoacid:ferredoxin oxidoreductase delta subunit
MEMLLTTVGFFGLTAIFVWLHLRVRGGSGAAAHGTAGPVPNGKPCARCKASVPSGSTFCPKCGIPQQIYEVVSAAVVPDEGEGTAAASLKALVRADMCVGCGTCVAACPEAGAITLHGKLAVVDNALCKGHGECASACPVGAISMNAGSAVNRVRVPLLDEHFQTNVGGLYIVGELGGRGLIKNAINEGKIAVDHVATSLESGGRAPNGVYDVAIVGSGPAGLSAGLEALRRELNYVLLEQGTLSDTVRKYPRHKLLLAEPVAMPMIGDLWVADASKEALLHVWETIVANTGLVVKTGEKVETVQRDGDVFRVTTPNGEVRARKVVLAIGRRGSPRRLGVAGEELEKVLYDIVEMEAFAGRRVLVVGGGDSAVESALGLANQPNTEVLLSYRGDALTRIKDRNRTKFDAAVAAQRVRPIYKSTVREIRTDVVVLDIDGESAILPNDYVVIRVGGDAPYAFLERLGVRIVQKDVPIPREAAYAG